ncbi:Pepsin II-4 [Symbiodinium microadriaticum]|uniref:Pepsin II-4 n=1 Tax=Symbiodinium microadriaticum TaxID=2951 RepID=A0A1Q9EAH6_SYMMI|nr:Pepsin II-4 [Symbiodinium microadriaticum]
MDTAHSLQSSVLPPPGLEGFCAHKCDPKKPLKRRRGKRPSPAKVSRDSRRQHKFIGTSLGLPSTTRLAGVIQALVLGATGVLSEDISACLRQGSAKGRRRDVLPLPLLLEWPADVDLMGSKAADALHFAKFCIVSLNVLWSDFKTSRLCRTAPGKPTAPQLEAQKHIAAKTARMLSRFNSASGASWEWQGSFQKFEQAGSARSEPLVGSAVDLPNRAGTCDPLLHVGADLQAAITDAASIFPDAPTHAIGPVSSSTDNYGEYVKLVAREIACGKMRLRRSVRGVAPVFAVGKSAAGHQRKIWNGAELSEVAARPPAPPRLANPSSFLDLDLEPQEAVWFSKRDAETFFDVLKVPEELTPWFGQPAVRVKDLLEAGAFDVDFVNSLVDDLDATPLQVSEDIFPVSTVWPMGFSWSSVVAQSTTLACVTRAGVPLECALSVECPPPSHQAELCMVATDDVVFMHRDKARASETLQKFDSCLEEAGIPRKAVKDVTCADEVTALGCDIHSRPHVAEPSKPKLVTCVSALLDVLGQKRASPRAVNGLLGLLQWLCLLQRPVFGVFNKVYDFVRQQPDTHKAELPVAVLRELAVALGLMPLLSVSLDRQYLGDLLACDAAPEFGFGVSACRCSPDLLKRVGRLAERRGDYVRVHKAPGADERTRLGNPHRLSLAKEDFRHVVSAPARWTAHSSTLEGHALLLTLKWASRSVAKHHKKLAIMVDAKAVLGAASKGRTSAAAVRGVVRAVGAYSLCCDFLLRLVYIPSEDNPADAPRKALSPCPWLPDALRVTPSSWLGDHVRQLLDELTHCFQGQWAHMAKEGGASADSTADAGDLNGDQSVVWRIVVQTLPPTRFQSLGDSLGERILTGDAPGSDPSSKLPGNFFGQAAEDSPDALQDFAGPLHVDTYRVGPMKVDKQPFAMIREMSGEVFGSFPFEGILGLAFPSLSFGGIEPFFERVIRKKLLKNNEFAFYLNAESSQPSALLWGGVDKGLYEGSIVMVPVALPHYWALELVDFRIGNRSLMDTDHSAKKYLIIDTGRWKKVFMRHFFTVFSRGSGNLSEARVGFAKARAGATPKVPVMRRNPSI